MAVAGCGSNFRCDIVHPCEALEGQDPNQREVSTSSSIPLLYVMCVPGLFHAVLRH